MVTKRGYGTVVIDDRLISILSTSVSCSSPEKRRISNYWFHVAGETWNKLEWVLSRFKAETTRTCGHVRFAVSTDPPISVNKKIMIIGMMHMCSFANLDY